jgi:hypothetical protein
MAGDAMPSPHRFIANSLHNRVGAADLAELVGVEQAASYHEPL